ncbi:MAG: hypothetical protein Q4G69_09280 [Planctomycetia bacterium]|nr:hypothetical protein [Planctomycetia bacterium]
MKQIYYTSCLAGRSLSGNGGYQIRALSADLAPDQARTFVPVLAFELPWNDSDFLAEQSAGKSNPIRFAFLDDPDRGPFAVHCVDAGLDPATGRTGNFFAHLVCDLSPEISLEQIVGLWKDPFWKTADGDFDKHLDSPESLPKGSFFTEERFASFLQKEKNAAFFLFVMNAWIRREEEACIYLAAPSETIAFVLWGMLRFLHPVFHGDLTFSTYEINPSRTSAKIVGLWLPENGSGALPQYCKTEPSLYYNFITGSGSDLPVSEYLRYILDKCRKSRFADIVRFHEWIDREGSADLARLDLLAKILNGPERLNRSELQEILADSAFKPLLLKKLENANIASALKRFPEIDAILNPMPIPKPLPPVIAENPFEGIPAEEVPQSKFQSLVSSVQPPGFSGNPFQNAEEISFEEERINEMKFVPPPSSGKKSPDTESEDEEEDENTVRGFLRRALGGLSWWSGQWWFQMLFWSFAFTLLGIALWYFIPHLREIYKALSSLR